MKPRGVAAYEWADSVVFEWVVPVAGGVLIGRLRTNAFGEDGLPEDKALRAIKWTFIARRE